MSRRVDRNPAAFIHEIDSVAITKDGGLMSYPDYYSYEHPIVAKTSRGTSVSPGCYVWPDHDLGAVKLEVAGGDVHSVLVDRELYELIGRHLGLLADE